jgi:hypothetical protein
MGPSGITTPDDAAILSGVGISAAMSAYGEIIENAD